MKFASGRTGPNTIIINNNNAPAVARPAYIADPLGPEPRTKGMKKYARFLALAAWYGIVPQASARPL